MREITPDELDSMIDEMEGIAGTPMGVEQIAQWRRVLGEYKYEAVRDGWMRLIDSIVPGHLPAVRGAKEIFRASTVKLQNAARLEDSRNVQPDNDTRSYGSKVAQAVMKHLSQARERGGRERYHRLQSDFWQEMGDSSMAEQHSYWADRYGNNNPTE